MDRKQTLIQIWRTVFDEEGWYPPLKDALAGTGFQEALWKPDGKASHSIWEIVDHLYFYKERLLCRMFDKPFGKTTSDNHGTFFSDVPATAETWVNLVGALGTVHQQIGQKLATIDDSDLDSPLPEEPLGAQLLSLALHDAYHTGQIVQLRKLQGSWPAFR